MIDSPTSNPLDILKAVPDRILEDSYSDGVKDTVREFSKIGVDAVKTIRLALFPLQFTAAIQDRLAQYLDQSVSRVPFERRIAPVQSFALQIADRLKFQEPGNIVTEMYVSLLARAIDRERVGEAHPAFIHIVAQISSDEAQLIEQLSAAHRAAFFCNRDHDTGHPVGSAILKLERDRSIEQSQISQDYKERLYRVGLMPEKLSQPDLAFTYLQHLVSLGVAQFVNEKWTFPNVPYNIVGNLSFLFLELTQFGNLFRAACLSDKRTAASD